MIYSDSAHYEAQQMLKTIYHRHKAKKQLQESYSVLAVSELSSGYRPGHTQWSSTSSRGIHSCTAALRRHAGWP